jgi:hypothetical protein
MPPPKVLEADERAMESWARARSLNAVASIRTFDSERNAFTQVAARTLGF